MHTNRLFRLTMMKQTNPWKCGDPPRPLVVLSLMYISKRPAFVRCMNQTWKNEAQEPCDLHQKTQMATLFMFQELIVYSLDLSFVKPRASDPVRYVSMEERLCQNYYTGTSP